MVFFNYATMQMAAKIVYYGPGLCGKTTNLHVIYGRTAPSARGEMVCLETETDRTLFFDLLPLDVGVIGGFKTRLQLYTVPGQVFYNTTRKLVLKGVDGIVFVADSQRPMMEPNKESLKNLRDNLAEIGLTLESIPHVFQYNKRDLPSLLSVEELNDALNPNGAEWYEASATNGTGIFETLKAISKLTLRSLKSRMTGDPRRPTVVATAPTPAAVAIAGTATAVVPALGSSEPPLLPDGDGGDSTLSRLNRFREMAAGNAPQQPTAAPFPEAAGPEAPPGAVSADPSAELSFADIRPPGADEPPEPPVKHVRVRSNVDILAELEKLRKHATQRPPSRPAPEAAPRPRSSSAVSIDDLLSGTLNNRKDVAQSFDVKVPKEALTRSRRLTIALVFEGNQGDVVAPERKFLVELTPGDVRKLLLSLKFNVQAE